MCKQANAQNGSRSSVWDEMAEGLKESALQVSSVWDAVKSRPFEGVLEKQGVSRPHDQSIDAGMFMP